MILHGQPKLNGTEKFEASSIFVRVVFEVFSSLLSMFNGSVAFFLGVFML